MEITAFLRNLCERDERKGYRVRQLITLLLRFDIHVSLAEAMSGEKNQLKTGQ
jgi:hypothetical protein